MSVPLPSLSSMQSACAVLYCHLWPVWLYRIFPHYLTKGRMFGKKLLNIKCVFLLPLQILSEIFIFLKRIQRDININVYRYSCKVTVIFVRFQRNLIFLTIFSKNSQIPNFIKIFPAGAELLHADTHTEGPTDITNPIIAFRNFSKAPKNNLYIII
jgi:hypothetical protein